MNKKDTEKQTEEKIEQEEALQEENSQEPKIDENSHHFSRTPNSALLGIQNLGHYSKKALIEVIFV